MTMAYYYNPPLADESSAVKIDDSEKMVLDGIIADTDFTPVVLSQKSRKRRGGLHDGVSEQQHYVVVDSDADTMDASVSAGDGFGDDYEEYADDGDDVGVFPCELPDEAIAAANNDHVTRTFLFKCSFRSLSNCLIIAMVSQQPVVSVLSETVTAAPGDISGYAVPENFSMVVPGIYRSSFPHAENFGYLKKKNFKSVLYAFFH